MRTTQREKVEHLLRANGKHGLHSHEMRQAFIANPSQRIIELEAAGWSISHTRERLNGTAFGCRYVKVGEPEARRASVESDTHKMCGSSEISPGVPLAPDNVEVAGCSSNDLPHAGLVVPPAAGDLSTGRLFEVESTPRKHWDEAA